ncbi:Toxic anion resistance protein (TelA) [compost metagenome]
MSGKRSEISSNILKLRHEVDSLNKSKQLSLWGKIVRKTPMKNYIYKYQSVKTNVNAIIGSLRNGKDTLEENVVHMKNLKRMAIDEVYNLQARIELGTQLKGLFEQEINNPLNEDRKVHLERGLRKVVTRIQSFTEMIMLYQQAIAGTDIINDNNDKLIDAVDSTIDKTQHLITISAMISMALQDQMDVIDAVNSANKTIEDQFAENARLLRETTQKTSEALTKPAMSLEKINQAVNDLTAAMDMYEQSNRKIIQTSTEHTTRMTEINKQLSDRLGFKLGASPAAIKDPAVTSFLE